MSGYDPYSSSRGCAELVTAAYRRSLLAGIGVASARAGNVIGGGDWAEQQLLPDRMRAHAAGRPLANLIRTRCVRGSTCWNNVWLSDPCRTAHRKTRAILRGEEFWSVRRRCAAGGLARRSDRLPLLLQRTFVDLGRSPLSNALLTMNQLTAAVPRYPLHDLSATTACWSSRRRSPRRTTFSPTARISRRSPTAGCAMPRPTPHA